MKASQIAVQLYTLRAHCKRASDFALTCRKVKALGYAAVEMGGVDGGVVSEHEMAAVCAGEGLAICALHAAPEEVLESPLAVADRAEILGTRYVVYPFPAGVNLGDAAAVDHWIMRLGRAGAALAARGFGLAYHNHHHEFRRLDGRLILERIYAETSAQHLLAEPDTYWIQVGGGNPVAWCRQLAGRLPLLHLKDYRINATGKVEFAEVGWGNLDIPGILEAARAAACEWYVVEQDACPGDPFESIGMSYRYLRALAID